MDYRIELLRLKLSRKDVAQELDLSYSQLSSRIAGFIPWQGDEERRLIEIISKVQDAQALTEKGARCD
jgi:DNA-binding TFAR19-related protein (PDSD5 family)